MATIKERAEEYAELLPQGRIAKKYCKIDFMAGANYVLDAIIKCLPKTHSFNPNEVIDIITSIIKQLKK